MAAAGGAGGAASPPALQAVDSALLGAAAAAPCVPIVFGNIAFHVAKTRAGAGGGGSGEHPYKWTVFVRAPDNSDLTYAISKVVFKLHETFNPPIREVTTPPFQVSETGWGAFNVEISIHLRDPAAQPIKLVHLLKLFHDAPLPPMGTGAGGAGGAGGAAERPVLSEHYDEIVFNELPADSAARDALLKGPGAEPPPYPYAELLGVFTVDPDLRLLGAARRWVADRTAELEERLGKARAAREVLQHRHLVELGVL